MKDNFEHDLEFYIINYIIINLHYSSVIILNCLTCQFNLNKKHGEPNNQPTLRQPAPLVLSHYGKDVAGNMSQSMEMAVTLARRDIRLRNVVPLHDGNNYREIYCLVACKPLCNFQRYAE